MAIKSKTRGGVGAHAQLSLRVLAAVCEGLLLPGWTGQCFSQNTRVALRELRDLGIRSEDGEGTDGKKPKCL